MRLAVWFLATLFGMTDYVTPLNPSPVKASGDLSDGLRLRLARR